MSSLTLGFFCRRKEYPGNILPNILPKTLRADVLQTLATTYINTWKASSLLPNFSNLPINSHTPYSTCSTYIKLCHSVKPFFVDTSLVASARNTRSFLPLPLYLLNSSFSNSHFRDVFLEHPHPNSGIGGILWIC